MQYLEHIEQAARRLYRIQASLALVAKAGPEAGFENVMEVNDLMREEVAKVLILLDQAGQIQAVSAAIAPTLKEKGEVLAFRPSPTA